jgi:hypothetical protein
MPARTQTTLAELGQKVFYYRQAGEKMTDIGDLLGVSVPVVRRAYQAFIEHCRDVGALEPRDIATELELQRLDEIIKNFWIEATIGQDAIAARTVMTAIMNRAKIQRLDQLDVGDQAAVQQILVVGQSQAEFLRALQSARQPELAGAQTDNEVVAGTVEEELV